MTIEIENAIRDKVAQFQATGRPLVKGVYTNCLMGALGGEKAAIVMLGKGEAFALECGFEGWRPGVTASLHPAFYDLGQKIAKENGV